MTRFGLSEETLQKINGVFAKYPDIEQAILYGSRAKGTYKNGSDIDLTLKGERLTAETLYRIFQELEDLFLPYKIDLSLFYDLEDPSFLDHIGRVGVVVYSVYL
ncbi:MAG: nucleotidyltransferase domain-containing protein [Candidatus Margulisiibacteriota bacterium]